MTHIILLDDGKIWAFEPPEKLKSPTIGQSVEYERAYYRALEQKLEVENPEEAFQMVYGIPFKKNAPAYEEYKVKPNEPIKWEGGYSIQHQIYETSGKWVDTHELMYSKFPDDRRRKLVRLIAPVKEEIGYGLSRSEHLTGPVPSEQENLANYVDLKEEQENQEEMFTMDQMLDLVAAFNISTSCESVEDAKEEFPNLFKSKRRVAKEWITKVLTRK